MSPSAFYRQRPIEVIRRMQHDGVRVRAGLHAEDSAPPKDGFNWEQEQDLVARGVQTYAMILTHDCDIENPEKGPYRLLGLIRSWDNVPQDERIKIEEQRVFRFFFLAQHEGEPEFGPAYVDLRRLTTIHKDVLRDADRLLSLTEEVRQALKEAIVRFFARVEE